MQHPLYCTKGGAKTRNKLASVLSATRIFAPRRIFSSSGLNYKRSSDEGSVSAPRCGITRVPIPTPPLRRGPRCLLKGIRFWPPHVPHGCLQSRRRRVRAIHDHWTCGWAKRVFVCVNHVRPCYLFFFGLSSPVLVRCVCRSEAPETAE